MRRTGTWSAIVVIGLACTGCGDDQGLATVKGKVTLNGEPIAKGNIEFIPQDGQTPTAGALIQEGQFTARVPPGVKKVVIHAPKVVGETKLYDTPDSPTRKIVEDQLEKFNKEKEMTLDVKPGQNPPVEYTLTIR